MTTPGIDIEVVALKLHKDLRLEGFEYDKSIIIDSLKALCLRVAQAATKAERERCSEIARNHYCKALGNCSGSEGAVCNNSIVEEILEPNGETK